MTEEQRAAGRGGWPLRRRLSATYAVIAVVLSVAAVLVAVFLVGLDRSVRRRGEVLAPARVQSARLLSSLVSQETGVRGFALQPRDDFLVPFTVGRGDEEAAADRLRALLRAEPGQQQRVDAVEQAAQVWRADYGDPVVAAARRGGARAADALDPEIGRARFDEVRTAAAALDRSLDAATAASTRAISRALQDLVVVLVAAGAGVVALLVLLVRALRSWVIQPLLRVGGDALTVARGDLDREIQPAGPPEIAAVAAGVETMRLQLLAELEIARRAQADVEAASVQLELQADDLRRSNRDLEQFAYVASHDLQEPLRKVASFCQMLDRRYSGQLDERADTYIAFAVDGAKRMQALIADLLEFSRVGRTTESFTEVRLDTVLARALAALATALEGSDGVVTADPLPVVHGDATLLAQLLQNLIGNAVKFRGDAAPRVHISAERHSTAESDEWEIICADNGIGIGTDYAEKIFVIFQRLHGRDSYTGTGIGLALCRKIVEFHGGKIWLDTTVATGSVFRFTLPVRLPSPTPPTPVLASLPVLTGGTT